MHLVPSGVHFIVRQGQIAVNMLLRIKLLKSDLEDYRMNSEIIESHFK